MAILRTDTLYGVVARADNESAVERIYELKGRDETKPCIVLLPDAAQAYDPLPKALTERWPGPVSIIAPSPHAPAWVRRSGTTVAYRLPADESLRALLAQTGPLIAPSANLQGAEPARDIAMAQDYFGERVDAYVDEGAVPVGTPPSELWRIDDNGQWEQLR